MLQDLRYALRMLAKSPGFTAVALLTLALGIGANTAIFTLVDATLLRQLPVGRPQELAILTNPASEGLDYGTSDGTRDLLAYGEYELLRDHNTVFTGLLAAESGSDQSQVSWPVAGEAAGAEPARTKLVSGNYFSVLQVPAHRGRTFAPGEGLRAGADPVAVITDGYWNQRFHRDPAALGRVVEINGHAFTVIGVAPPGFSGENVGDAPDLFFPINMATEVEPGRDRLHDAPGVSRLMWLQAIGRLKPGIRLQAADAEVNAIFLQSIQQQAGAATDPQMRHSILDQKLVLSEGGRGASGTRGEFASPLLALFALVGLVLLLATVNLASLLLARAAARQKEMGVRLALGAGRGRILRQLLTESTLLSVIGGTLGALLAVWGDRALLAMVSDPDNPIQLSLRPDWRVLGFVAALCVCSGVLFGLAPALRMARLDLNAALQAEGRGGSGRTRHVLGRWVRGGLPLGKALVIGQVALSILLLVCAGLFVRSLQKLTRVPLGFNAEHLLEFSISPGTHGYSGAATLTFYHRLLDATAALPGVRGVALADDGLFAHSESGLPIAVNGFTPPKGQQGAGARFDQVSSDYFQTTGIAVVLGRGLTPRDEESGPIDAVINQTMRRQFFAARNPLGQELHDLYPDDNHATYTVAGVVQDAKYNALGEKTPPRFYLPFFNGLPGDDHGGTHVLVRGWGNAGAMAQALRQTIRGIDPNLPAPDFRDLSQMIDESLTTQRMLARLSGFFGGLALLLAAIGLYGVTAYGVARRGPEIGVRMALGADRGAVIGMIMGETGMLVGLGLLVGAPASLAGAKVVASQMHLFGLSYYDPTTLGAAVAILAAVGALAGYLPARRASRIDPLQALREE